MNSKDFHNSKYFDLSSFKYPEILDGPAWDSISLMSPFILKLFADGKLTPNFRDKPYVFVGENTKIHDSVEIDGPAVIGNNCDIRHAAFLREGCIIADDVIIGHAVEVKHSIIMNKAFISHLSYIGDSVVGNHVNVSGGAIIANFRLDKKNVSIRTQDGEIDTKLQKFGAAIGDFSVIGVNSVLNPGTILGRNSKVFPLTSVRGIHEENSVIK